MLNVLIVAVLAVGGPPVLVEPGRAWTYEAELAIGGPPVLVEPGRAWTYEAELAIGGPPVLVEPGRAWTYEASVTAGGPPVLVEPGRAWVYEASVTAGGPPVLVEPGRTWVYEASVTAGGPPVLVEPGRTWTYEGSVNAGGPPVLVEAGRTWTYGAEVTAGGPPVVVEPGRAWTYDGEKKTGECTATQKPECSSVAKAACEAKNLEVRYVILPRSEDDSEVSVVRTLSAANTTDCGSKDVAVLKLRSNLIQKGTECVSEAKHPASAYFNFAPIPPDYGKVLVGSKREDAVKVEIPEGTFAPGRIWTASYADDGMLEVVCAAKTLPAAAEANANVKLEGYRELYRVDPMSGVTATFQRMLTVRDGDAEPRTITVNLRLKKWEDLTDDQVKAEAPLVAKN